MSISGLPQDKKASSLHSKMLLIGCIGVVYGDIGTSPLYAFRAAAKHIAEGGITNHEILGLLSLIIWALTLIVTIKYVLFLLRIDNKGEGGILSLMALAKRTTPKKMGLVFFAGVTGAALFFGDAIITPAISVMSAMEGTTLITPAFEKYVLPISMLILVGLFSVQKYGTAHMSKFFGPITTLWFLTMGVAGLFWIIKYPVVLNSLSPHYAVMFLFEHGLMSFLVLGAVFLAVTGAEALYSDLGHFGRKPIQTAWLYLVFPCLTLNYMGQGALLMAEPTALDNPFFLLFPQWALIPMVIFATIATVIASQAMITGAFSLARQAMQLGLLPRLEIQHTSETQEGQIYMPKINFLLLCGVLFLCIVFEDASSLAAAYGIAISGTMVASSILTFIVISKVLKKGVALAAALIIPFIAIEIVFFSANLLKVADGGFVPLLFGFYAIFLVTIWVRGTRYLVTMAQKRAISTIDIVEMVDRTPPQQAEGTAIFLTSDPDSAPETLMQNLKHNQILHAQNIILTVLTASTPRVPLEKRVTVEILSPRFTRVIVNFGFMETPNVPAALYRARSLGYNIDVEKASFYLGHRRIIASPNKGLPLWQDNFYIAMTKMAVDATDYFRIPHDQVFEIGMQQVV
jgi:KUP system potassium uptake protein